MKKWFLEEFRDDFDNHVEETQQNINILMKRFCTFENIKKESING